MPRGTAFFHTTGEKSGLACLDEVIDHGPPWYYATYPTISNQRLKETAAAHHRSMNQEAIVVLKGALVRESGGTPKPTREEFAGQVKDLWAMPVLHRAPDEIIGYDDTRQPLLMHAEVLPAL